MRTAAIVTIRDAAKMSSKGRKAIADWLKRQANFLVKNNKQMAGRFTARYHYQ